MRTKKSGVQDRRAHSARYVCHYAMQVRVANQAREDAERFAGQLKEKVRRQEVKL